MGDMNINLADANHRHARKLTAFLESKLLRQVIGDLTRVTPTSKSLIDHIYTNINHVGLSGTINNNISDHFPIFLIKKKARCTKSFKEVLGRKYKSENLTDFEKDIKSIDARRLFESGDPNTIWGFLFVHIMRIVDRHFQIQTIKIPISRPFYLDVKLLKLMHQRDVAFRYARREKTQEAWALARKFRARVSKDLRTARKRFICNQIDVADGDGQKFWHIINNAFFKATSKAVNEITDPETGKTFTGKAAADSVNNYFCGISEKLAVKFHGRPVYDLTYKPDMVIS